MELKVIMHRRIARPNADIQLFLQFRLPSLFCFEESVLQLHSVRLWLWLDDPSALHVTPILPFLNILIYLYTTLQERTLSPY
jgi:hypothetical protein